MFKLDPYFMFWPHRQPNFLCIAYRNSSLSSIRNYFFLRHCWLRHAYAGLLQNRLRWVGRLLGLRTTNFERSIFVENLKWLERGLRLYWADILIHLGIRAVWTKKVVLADRQSYLALMVVVWVDGGIQGLCLYLFLAGIGFTSSADVSDSRNNPDCRYFIVLFRLRRHVE
jgi:hypothetical protein